MIEWLGGLQVASDVELISDISEVFGVTVRKPFTPIERHVHCRTPQAVVLNLGTADAAQLSAVEAVDRRYPGIPIVVKVDVAQLNGAVKFHPAVAGRVEHDVSADELLAVLRAAMGRQRAPARVAISAAAARPVWRKMLVGESPAIEQIAQQIEMIANRRSTVLITGETGTGKEVVARAIHAASDRARYEMVTVNCGAIPESLLEAELFGHARGAFTGAVGQRIGRFEQAHRGAIFLDEIGDMPLAAQTSLLRVLQEKEFHRVGGVETVRIDVRVIAATNVNLRHAVENKTFRSDLLYRLQVFPIFVPPLRERAGDIVLLAEHFLEALCAEEGLPYKRLSSCAADRLTGYEWPGNVRQLRHALEMATVMSGARTTLEADDFSLPEKSASAIEAPSVELPDDGVDFESLVNEVQRSVLQVALKRAGGNKSRAASLLNMKRSTLVSKVKALAG
jgi:DNA-binding NtrC family response regulator